jgi:peptide/nickel transport system ATP-binding protein
LGLLSVSAILEVEGLRTEFRLRHSTVVAVDDVSFHVDQGECVGLVGESGCGKTTTGLSIMRLLPNVGHITAGSIRLGGRDLVPLPEREMCKVRGNDVGMIFQDPLTSLNPTMTIGRQIAESVRLHRDASKRAARLRALQVLEMVDMPRPLERLDAYPHQLSGGLRQRVMIAMALACEPKLLIADEPTTALDLTIQAQILDLMRELKQKIDAAIVLITHDLGVVAEMAQRVVVMYAGRKAEEAPVGTLFRRPLHPYTKGLLASVPRLGASLDREQAPRLAEIPGTVPSLREPIPGCPFETRCGFATDICRREMPSFDEKEPGHFAACFHSDQVAAA